MARLGLLVQRACAALQHAGVAAEGRLSRDARCRKGNDKDEVDQDHGKVMRSIDAQSRKAKIHFHIRSAIVDSTFY